LRIWIDYPTEDGGVNPQSDNSGGNMAGRGGLPRSGFGAALRREREAKGLTQKQLGEASGLHPNTVAKLERGDQEPAWPAVLALAAALGVSCEAFSWAAGPPTTDKPSAAAGKPRGKAGGRK
jgi:DNA-binding XRE family transcriptional regulator